MLGDNGRLVFPTLQFAAFMLVLLVLLFLFRRSTPRKRILLVASWIFYMAWNPAFIWLLLASSFIDYFAGRRMQQQADGVPRRFTLTLALTANLGLLAYFKYAGFLSGSLLWLLRAGGLPVDWALWQVTLPVGISFYTFQTMSYSIDIYRRRMEPARSLLDYLLYVSFFPQLVAGPIVRAADFLPQLQRPVQLRFDPECVILICSGLVKKVLIADNLAPLVEEVLHNPAGSSSLAVMLAAFCFAVQVYCDFSGYAEIAIGLGRLLGFWIPPNFNRPYFATNPTDFWRRWHISLSSWLRDYLYIPLGGNRGGRLLTLRNLLLTMLISGLWHGASWNFVLFGLVHGLLLAGHHLYSLLLPRWPLLLAFGRSRLGQGLGWALLMYCWTGSLVFFRLTDPQALLHGLQKFFIFDGSMSFGLSEQLEKFTTLSVLLAFCLGHALEHFGRFKIKLAQAPLVWTYVYTAVVVVLLALFWPSRSAPFVYFQF